VDVGVGQRRAQVDDLLALEVDLAEPVLVRAEGPRVVEGDGELGAEPFPAIGQVVRVAPHDDPRVARELTGSDGRDQVVDVLVLVG
jgi:hypothetical protein